MSETDRYGFVVGAQPGSHAIGGNRGSSTTAESESIDDSGSRRMHQSHWSVSFWFCAGTTRELIYWLISRDTGSSGGAQPIEIT